MKYYVYPREARYSLALDLLRSGHSTRSIAQHLGRDAVRRLVRQYVYPREARYAHEWCLWHAKPIEVWPCPDCGCLSDRERCEDCDRETGAGDA